MKQYYFKRIFIFELQNHLFLLRLSAGLPHISNLLIRSVRSNFLAALSSDKKSCHDLKSKNIFPFEVLRKAMAVWMVVVFQPSMIFACRNQRSDWLQSINTWWLQRKLWDQWTRNSWSLRLFNLIEVCHKIYSFLE